MASVLLGKCPRFQCHVSIPTRSLTIEANHSEIITNSQATRMMKHLYKSQCKSPSTFLNESIATDALQIYQQIREPPNHYSINTFLKLLLHFDCPHHHEIVSPDITNFLSAHNPSGTRLIAFTSLLKCCVGAPSSVNTNHGLQIMEWMDTTKYAVKPFETRDYSRSVSRLITACSRYEDIHRIDCLLRKRNVDDIHIATALVNGYGRTNSIDDALSTFRCTNKHLRNSVHINEQRQVTDQFVARHVQCVQSERTVYCCAAII